MLLKRSTLLSIDAFARAEDDVRIRTRTGALITIGCLLLTTVLLLNEWFQYHTLVIRPSLVIDRERQLGLELNLDVSFPAMPCDLLNLDILDDSGSLLLDNNGKDNGNSQFTKWRLDANGQVIEQSKSIMNLGDDVLEFSPEDKQNYCGSCYGAKDQSGNADEGVANSPDKRVCCQTCQQVRDAYLDAGWAFFDGKNIEQCEREGYVSRVNQHLREGCRVQGSAKLNRINGNIHFAPGMAFQNNRGHFHDTSLYEQTPHLNFNHKINHLSFGPELAKDQDKFWDLKQNEMLAPASISPLDGQTVKPDYNSHDYKFSYFTKIVSTRYEYLDGTKIETVQFSSTFHEKPLAGGQSAADPSTLYARGGSPGLYFYIEMSPLKVINRQEHKISWSSFILNCVTSIGGILAVGALCDKILYKAQTSLFAQRKQ